MVMCGKCTNFATAKGKESRPPPQGGIIVLVVCKTNNTTSDMKTNNANNESLADVVSSIPVGGAKFSVTMETTPKFIGGKANKYTGHVTKQTRIHTAFNGDYATNLINTAKKAGATADEIETATAEINASPYNHLRGALFSLRKDPLKMYCRVMQKRDEQVGNTTHWYLDGVEVTDKITLDDIKANLYKPKPSNARLDNLGIAAEEQSSTKYVSLDSIRAIKQGANKWERGL